MAVCDIHQCIQLWLNITGFLPKIKCWREQDDIDNRHKNQTDKRPSLGWLLLEKQNETQQSQNSCQNMAPRRDSHYYCGSLGCRPLAALVQEHCVGDADRPVIILEKTLDHRRLLVGHYNRIQSNVVLHLEAHEQQLIAFFGRL